MTEGNLQPIDFEAANKKLTAVGCEPLPVFHEKDVFVSCWELTDKQIEQITDTKRIYLGVLGKGHPPVWLTVDYPFQEPDAWPDEIQLNEGDEDGKT